MSAPGAAPDEELIRAAIAGPARPDRRTPIGAVLFGSDGAELARAANAREELSDPRRTRRFSRSGLPPGCLVTAGD